MFKRAVQAVKNVFRRRPRPSSPPSEQPTRTTTPPTLWYKRPVPEFRIETEEERIWFEDLDDYMYDQAAPKRRRPVLPTEWKAPIEVLSATEKRRRERATPPLGRNKTIRLSHYRAPTASKTDAPQRPALPNVWEARAEKTPVVKLSSPAMKIYAPPPPPPRQVILQPMQQRRQPPPPQQNASCRVNELQTDLACMFEAAFA